MKIINLKNEKKSNFFSPEYSFFVFEDYLPVNVEITSKILLEKEKEIINKYPPYDHGGTQLSKESVTSRFIYYNLLKFSEFVFLKKYIRKAHDNFLRSLNLDINEDYYVQCWFNVMREGEEIKKHNHAFNIKSGYLSGHICIKVDKTNTYYELPYSNSIFESKNEPAKITLFPSWVDHYTDKVESGKKRITIAFDIRTKKSYSEDVKNILKPHWEKI
jgi:hypothetical protein